MKKREKKLRMTLRAECVLNNLLNHYLNHTKEKKENLGTRMKQEEGKRYETFSLPKLSLLQYSFAECLSSIRTLVEAFTRKGDQKKKTNKRRHT